jgi:translation initiation factor IF-2
MSRKKSCCKFLRESHGAGGEADGGPKKITLKRKTVSTLKTGSGAAKKIVSVEVRKKRTYVKRDDIDDAATADEVVVDAAAAELVSEEVLAVEKPQEITPVVDVVEVAAVAIEETLSVVESAAQDESQSEVVPEAKPISKLSGKILGRSALDDAEQRRQTAILARRASEEVERIEDCAQEKRSGERASVQTRSCSW